MAIRKFKFQMTVKIEQELIVEIDEKDVPKGQDIEDFAQETANQTWDSTQSTNDEKYDQEASLIEEIK